MVYGDHGLLFKPVFKVFYNFTFYCSFNNGFFAILFVVYLCNILDY